MWVKQLGDLRCMCIGVVAMALHLGSMFLMSFHANFAHRAQHVNQPQHCMKPSTGQMLHAINTNQVEPGQSACRAACEERTLQDSFEHSWVGQCRPHVTVRYGTCTHFTPANDSLQHTWLA